MCDAVEEIFFEKQSFLDKHQMKYDLFKSQKRYEELFFMAMEKKEYQVAKIVIQIFGDELDLTHKNKPNFYLLTL